MVIDDKMIDYVAALSKLSLTGPEKEKAKEDLSEILGYMDVMNEVDTDEIEPMSHVLPIKNVFREDVVTNKEDREKLLLNAPKKKNGCFIVPKTVE